MIMKILKEVCEPCCKSINIGQPLLECEICRTAIHAKCFKAAKFSPVDNMWMCKNCSQNITPRYNPFSKLITESDSEKFYDDEGTGDDTGLEHLSHLLSNCNNYTASTLDATIDQLGPNNSSGNSFLSTYFVNIDGNGTNFDNLLVDLHRIKHKFAIIGIAETNTDQPLQDLYQIPGYNSFYQTTIVGKAKGTGVAIYVADHLNAEVIGELGSCTPDLESIFIKVSLPTSNEPLTYGVLYRPPNGDMHKFSENFEVLSMQLPKYGVRLLGDYNIDLLKMNTAPNSTGNHTRFEELYI